ncbi:DUF6695 family protein [uncultured Polaribacter sp.]|uniref:DUF6695 family protein n=1 Tax=uncultured Polaribacter sp. TaxID=174711 RepID=UPI0026380853|nr:DUF6695 family protein [uncultured Polaribacter sp.]
MSNSDGIIIILSYPDTIVRPAYWEPSSKIWPKIGIGSKHAVQAGHAALVLINKENLSINYFDFGRYITTYGNGRVRSKDTDPELEIPITPEFKNGELSNLNNILLWLERHPEKTHGEGKLIVSVNTKIDYKKAEKYINNLIKKKEIPYGAFIKGGSNCARFVTEILIQSCNQKKIKQKLKSSNLLTPSPIGNVIKGNCDNKIYEVYNQKINDYKNRSILKEYKESFFNKFDVEPNLKGTELPDREIFNLENGTWLGGIGSGAWFQITEQIDTKKYKIARYNLKGEKDFEALFAINKIDFNPQINYSFIHPTNCVEAYIKQNENIFSFVKTK